MIYDYCKACGARGERCLLPDSHRAQNKIVWCVDFLLGGKHGQRIRKQMKPGVTKKEAEKFEHITIADFERGLFLPTDKSKTKFNVIIDKYFNEHLFKHAHSPIRTLESYHRAIIALFGHYDIGSITLQTLQDGRDKYLQEHKIGNSGINRLMSIVKTALKRAVEWGYLQKSPNEYLKDLPIKESIPRFLTIEEIARLRAQIKDRRLDDYVSILLHTGIRPINIKALTWGNVDLPNRVIHITTYKGRRPHNYAVPIDAEMAGLLERRHRETQGRGLVFDTSNLRKLAEAAILDSGINEGRKEEEQFTIYGLKHCYASHLLMNGASIFDVAKLLGHTDTAMVIKHYGHLTQEHLRSVQSKINLTPPNQIQFKVL